MLHILPGQARPVSIQHIEKNPKPHRILYLNQAHIG